MSEKKIAIRIIHAASDLPFVIGSLLVALEMSNALLLLGELGLVSVFIGGGGIIAGDGGIPTQIVAEVPEWGALLGSTWRYFRSFPWLPGAPALLFAISILGFNLFGFGLQRFIARGRFYPSGISVLRFAGTVAAILLGVQFLLSSMSPENAYEDVAVDFDALRAWEDITILTRPELEGRYPDSEGRNIAAGYIANVFAEGGLTPLPFGNYFQTFTTLHGTITADSVAEFISPDEHRCVCRTG